MQKKETLPYLGRGQSLTGASTRRRRSACRHVVLGRQIGHDLVELIDTIVRQMRFSVNLFRLHSVFLAPPSIHEWYETTDGTADKDQNAGEIEGGVVRLGFLVTSNAT